MSMMYAETHMLTLLLFLGQYGVFLFRDMYSDFDAWFIIEIK